MRKPLRLSQISLATYCYLQTTALAILVWYFTRYFYVDDAFISLRYARNLLDGLGMVWQPDERVEGYTNFLMIMLEAGLGWLGMELVLASRVIGIASFFALLIILAWYTRLLPSTARTQLNEDEKLCGALVVSIAGSSVPLLVWAIGGLEGDLFAAILTAAVCLTLQALRQCSVQKTVLIGGIFALATLARPEGFLFFGFTFVFMTGLAMMPSYRTNIRIKHLAFLLLSYALIFIPYMAWRITYFGEWLPNTYYAKVHNITGILRFLPGLYYIFQYAFMPPLLPLFAFGLAVFVFIKGAWDLTLSYLFLFTGLFFAYIVDVGGDYINYFRFMTTIIPVMALLIYHCGLKLVALDERKWWSNIRGGLLFFLVFQIGLVGESERPLGFISSRIVSPYIKSHFPPGSLIAINPMGGLPYNAPEYRYVDMLGLLDKTIARSSVENFPDQPAATAHLKGDAAYVLSRRPDYIIWGHIWGSDTPVFPGDIQMNQIPEFHKAYKKVETYLTPPSEFIPTLQQEFKKNVWELKLNAQNQVRFVYFQRKK